MPITHASATQFSATQANPKKASASVPSASSLFPGQGISDPRKRLSVLLPLPLDGTFDYLTPPGDDFPAGSVVRVPFGRRESVGVVWDNPQLKVGGDETPLPESRLKEIIGPCPVPPLTAVARRFIEWVATYCLAPEGNVLRMALSSAKALEEPSPHVAYELAEGSQNLDLSGKTEAGQAGMSNGIRLTPARRRVLQALQNGPARGLSDLAREAAVSTSVIKGLVDAGLIERRQVVPQAPFRAPDPDWPGPELSADQSKAAADLRQKVVNGGYSVTLLDGVTGSGKTEVYFEAVAAALSQQAQILVLLPEIALSAQWLARFAERFGSNPAVWHSDMTSKQRRLSWRAVAEGKARVVVGARSALFLPYQNLGLIVVDEEQDSSFKQEDGVTYNARDMAIVRARLGGIPTILASATPSLESLTNAAAGRYDRAVLPARYGQAQLPTIDVVDLRLFPPPRREGQKGSAAQSWLSQPLRTAIEKTLAEGEQVLLFLNRRGYAPLTLCRTCGHRLQCPNCTAWLVEHRLASKIQCHHCGYAAPIPNACPECGEAGNMAACGPGVERLSEEVANLYPEARQAVMASDTLSGPMAAAELIRAVQDHEIDLLIGTQIISKGHNFPNLTLVGVIDADLGLSGGDLRAGERTYQLLHQVAGRAGRAERPGRVMLQSYEPDHPVMRAMTSGDRDQFLAQESQARQAQAMPPFGRLAAVILSGPDPAQIDQIAVELARSAPAQEGFTLLGPAPAPLAILRGRHRRRFLLKSRRDLLPQAYLRSWLGRGKWPAQVRVQVDVDPQSFY
ncbi:MAG: primosomal protein N' [Pseudomonadota bacterium]